jgi:hypothetical protein
MQKRDFDAAEGPVALQHAVLDHHHLARLDLADELGPHDVERAGLGRQDPALAQPPDDERAHAQRVAHADELGPRHGDDREGALDPPQRVLHPLGDGPLERAGHQVDDAFRIRGGLEDRAPVDQFAPERVGVRDVAVMRDGRAAGRELAEEGLHVADLRRALRTGGGIAHMPDGERPGSVSITHGW